MAPPIRYHLDESKIADLASIGCSVEEIATLVSPVDEANRGRGMDSKVLDRRYGGTLKAGRNRMKGKLRSQLFAAAEAGNTAILIFLAKTVLGMREKATLEDLILPEGVSSDMPGTSSERPYGERGVVLWLREVMPSIERVTREVESEVVPDLPEIRELSEQELENWR